jgi:uridylate kinase
MLNTPYKRILLKLSGEALLGASGFGIDQEACLKTAAAISKLHQFGVEVAVVIGGGNIFRGVDLRSTGMPRTPADHMGMLATLLNGVALQQALELKGTKSRVMTALACPTIAESYNWAKALEYLKEKTVLIFVGGTGNPYFTTDTAAALRASEIEADVLFKATKVDGIYNKDPLKHPDAVKYPHISYSQVLAEKLQIMDATAIALCRSSQVPIYVFSMQRLFDESPEAILSDLSQGTLVVN